MAEEINNYPFKPSDLKVASSVSSDVNAYADHTVATKTPKVESGFSFPTLGHSISSIEGARESRNDFIKELEQLGSTSSLVPEEHYAIHYNPKKEITYTRIQTFYKDSPPLSQLNVFSLPRTSLVELRNIIKANYNIWKKSGHFNDIVGSSSNKDSLITRATKNMFPIFFSENILLTPNGRLKFIDTGRLPKPTSLLDVKNHIKQTTHLIGSVSSLAILDTIIMFKSKQKKQQLATSSEKTHISIN